ncbi:uncharacterized protein LOC121996500 [Zingiber officinale]|uniref:uncharacterized protein LOC121996500 n=1 Tax=Zingiber officinale TaxID=94328 RepID=UPI001C4CB18D|nr:uncharacterized protein LOC121996500 [Zingiber officinale]
MDNNIEGSSNLSSSSSDDDNYAESFSARQQLIAQVISTNNQIVLNYLNEGSNKSRHRGSIPGHKMINRNREAADRNLFNDYFAENALYNDAMFRRRFRMGWNLFMRIRDAVTNHDNYFIQRRDGLGRLGLSSLQKITVAFQILAYGVPADTTDEYIKIGESIAIESIIILAHYVIQGKEYNMGRKNKLFALKQEACRKDVERAFGVLQSRFAIVAGPSRFWQKNILHDILTSCIIMHNMIIEDERDLNASIVEHFEVPTPDVELAVDISTRFEEFLARYRQIKDKEAHIALRNALIEHLWEQYSNSKS